MTKRIFLLALLLGATVATMAQRYVGGDISLLPSYEAKGAEYYDEAGAPIDDPLAFFASKGMNAMRLRLFVQPAHASAEDRGQGVCQDLDYIVPLAKRVKQAGLRLLLDFHYSDFWADPAKQWTPRAWQGLDDETLADSLAQYTRRVLRRLKAEGATPDLIQPGNEISYGMLWGAASEGYAKACYPDAPKANWQRFARLLRRATEVCREECPEARIILHTERVSVSQQQDNAHYAALSYFVARAKEYQIDYDILGLSYYPYFHGALSELEGAIRLLESEASDKEVMVVETGYPYAWAVPGTTYDATSTWPTPVCRRLGDYAPSPRGRHGPLLVVYGGQRAGCQLLLARHGPLVQCPALRQPHGARHACPQSHGFLPLLLSRGSCGLPSSCRPSRLMVSRRQAGVCQASPRTGRGYGPQGRCPTVEGHQGKPHL